MTTKKDFAAEEWIQVLKAPMLAGMYIIYADLHPTSIIKESASMSKAIGTQPAPEGAGDFIGSIVADTRNLTKEEKEQMKDTDDLKGKDVAEMEGKLLAELAATMKLVTAKCTAEETAGFGQWLMGVAQATAEGGREGGFLGIGSERVSEKEKAALAQLGSTLGTQG